MPPRAPHRRHAPSASPARVLCGVACALAPAVVVADDLSEPAKVVAQVQPLNRFETEQERLRQLIKSLPAAYVDKVMDASELPPSEEADSDQPGIGFRAYLLESRWGLADASADNTTAERGSELGLRGEYRIDTINHGEWSLQLDTRARSNNSTTDSAAVGLLGPARERRGERATVRNLGFPVTPNRFADATLGDMYSEVTDVFGRSYRLSLSNSSVRGLSARLFDKNSDLRVGSGSLGQFAGGPYPGFEATQGHLDWMGYSMRLSDNLQAGVQVNRARGIRMWDPNAGASTDGAANRDTENATGTAAAINFGQEILREGGQRVRVTWLRSNTSGQMAGRENGAQAVFLEGAVRHGRYRQEAGIYKSDPNLRFGDSVLPSDARGAYWRIDYNDTRTYWGLGLDHETQNPSDDPARAQATRLGVSGNVHYRISRDTSVGGAARIIDTNYRRQLMGALLKSQRSESLNTYVHSRFSDWGTSRLSLNLFRNVTVVSNDVAATGEEISWEHDWVTGRYETQRPEFVTTLGFASDRSNGDRQTYPTVGLSFRQWPDASWSVGGSLRYTARNSRLFTSQGLSGSLDAERVIDPGWRVGAALQLNQARLDLDNSNSLSGPQVSRSNDKSLYVYLRKEGNWGRPYSPAGIGYADAAGAGSISGIVFLDENRDGRQQVGELGAPGVEIFLDGRQRVTTDTQGRFVFPLVGTGRHQLTLRPESVPLPFGVAREDGLVVDVPLRGQANAPIPVTRVAE